MIIFILPSRLTTIKSLNGAKEVLEHVSKDNILSFEVENDQKMVFNGSDKNGFVLVRYLDKDSNAFNLIDIEYTIEDASILLYKKRKFFNQMFRD